MALQNPNNLYTGGAVVFNTQPSTNFAIQLMAQKKAKDEALDEYYRKLPSTINEAGMRDQDRPGFMQRVSEMQQFYLQNRDAIKDPRRDGGAAQYNFEKLFRGVKGYTEESKTAAKTALELGKLRLNKDFSYVFDDPQTVERIAAHDLPIGTEGRADIDLHTLTIPPKPRSVEDWQRLNTTLTHGLTPGQTPTGKRETLPNFGVREHYVKQFDPQSLQTIGNRTLDMYGTDRDWRGAANQRFAQATPEEIEQLNGIFTAVMKRPMQGPADFFAAEQIVAHSQSTPGYKDTKDTFAEWKAKNAITSAQADARQARSDAKKEGSATGPIGNVLNTIQVSSDHKEGNWYTMTPAGNKQNLASIQQLLGDKVMPTTAISGPRANAPENRVEYMVEGGQVTKIKFKGLVYNRADFDRLQSQLDKEPAWSGRLRYPEAQQTSPGMAAPNKGQKAPAKDFRKKYNY